MKTFALVFFFIILLAGCAARAPKEYRSGNLAESVKFDQLNNKSISVLLREVKNDYVRFLLRLGISESILRYVPGSADGYPVYAYDNAGKTLIIKVERDSNRVVEAYFAD